MRDMRSSWIVLLGWLLLGGCAGMQTALPDLATPTIFGPVTPGGRVAPPPTGTAGNAVTEQQPGRSTAAAPGENARDFSLRLRDEFPNCGTSNNEEAFKGEVLRLVNRERAQRGLGAVTRNDALERQATQYACEMIEYRFFDHVNPETGSRLRDRSEDFGYDYSTIGENLAAGQTTPTTVMRDWMNSEGHRENILNPDFTELGIGYRVGGEFNHYWVQEFGRPAAAPVTR